MSTKLTRKDDFETRRETLKHLSDEELKNYFWMLADQAVTPLLELAKDNTSPSIERSVLMRMGFSSMEAKAIVDRVIVHQLMGKGCGHVVYRYSQLKKLSIREAGLALSNDQGFDEVKRSFGVRI